MEFFIGAALLFIVWKIFDSNKSSTENKNSIHTTTEIEERVGNTVIKKTIVEQSSVDQYRAQFKRPGDPESEIKLPSSPEMNTISTGDLMSIRALERAKERERLSVSSLESVTQAPRRKQVYSSGNHSTAIQADSTSHCKTCTKCYQALPAKSFYSSTKPSNPDGLSKWCKECLSKSNANKSSSERYKKCSKCGNRREKWNFHKSPKSSDGLVKWCIPCHDKDNKLRRKSA